MFYIIFSVSDFTLPTGAVLKTNTPAMVAAISNFPGLLLFYFDIVYFTVVQFDIMLSIEILFISLPELMGYSLPTLIYM